jgi:hypothetical protein
MQARLFTLLMLFVTAVSVAAVFGGDWPPF